MVEFKQDQNMILSLYIHYCTTFPKHSRMEHTGGSVTLPDVSLQKY